MNLQAVKKLCLAAARFEIIDAPNGNQWLGDGWSMYAVDGYRVTETAVPALFDLTAKQIANSTIREGESTAPIFAAREGFPGERPLKEIGMIYSEGDLFLALADAEGTGAMLLISAAALKPLKKDEDYRRYYLREKGAHSAVAVYGDLMCDALITPLAQATAAMVMMTAAAAARLTLWMPEDLESMAEGAKQIIAEAMHVEGE